MNPASIFQSRTLPRPVIAAGVGMLALAALAALALLYRVDPAQSPIFPPCIFHSLTGLYCPGCGATRALHHLLHGEIHAALAMNPLFVISLPVLAVFVMRPALTRKPSVAYAVMVIVIGYVILRNIPLWPLNLLAPHSLL